MVQSFSVTARTQDEAFHEIQLNGKQLLFLFMAATVVSVVIFLCGVLVGRNVRADRGRVSQSVALTDAPAADTVAPAATPAPSAAPAASDPTTAAPPPPVEDVSYPKGLEKQGTSGTDLSHDAKQPVTVSELTPARIDKPVATAPVDKPAKTDKTDKADKTARAGDKTDKTDKTDKAAAVPAPTPAPAQTANADATPASASGAPGDGYAVQVAALNVRSEADAIAKRLSSKGYAAYVQVPASGSGSVFRVRVGTFKTRREAETVAAKLHKEEQFTPWVTR